MAPELDGISILKESSPSFAQLQPYLASASKTGEKRVSLTKHLLTLSEDTQCF